MISLAGNAEDAVEEHKRIALLAELGVLDTAPEPGFDALTHAASLLTQCPMALVTLVDGERAWFKARLGFGASHIASRWSFCAHALHGTTLFEVPDASADPRFASNPFVVGQPGVRFYAGQPLAVDGITIGTLCVVDVQPRELDAQMRSALKDLGTAATALLAERRSRIASLEEQRRLSDFAMVSGDWLWETDTEHRVTWLSSGYATQPALPQPWLLGEPMADGPVLDVTGQPVAPPITLHRLFDESNAFARAIVRSPAPGQPSFLLHSAVCRRNPAGDWCGYRGISRDMRSRVEAEQARIDAAEVLADLSVQVPGLIFQFRREPGGHISFPYVNDRIADCGLTAAEVAVDAAPVLAHCHPQDVERLLKSIERSAGRLEVWRQTFRVLLPSRGERLVSGHAQPRRLDDGAVLWHGLITDVTEQVREAERLQELRRAQISAETAAQVRSDFMSRVSHELRTPLNAILGFAQLLRLNGNTGSAIDTLKAAAQIESAGNHLLSLVNDILDSSSLDAGRMNLQFEPISLAGAVRQSVALIEPNAGQRGMTIDVQAEPGTPTARADRRAVKQVILNLVGNAIKFGRPHSVLRIRIRHSDAEARALIEVTDEGPGIAADKLSTLFEPFSRIHTGQDTPVGSGLGLSISRKLVVAMKGRIDVESVVGQGTTFRVRLPVDGRPEAVEPPADDDAQPGGNVAEPLGRATVLYVEDEPVNALLMQEFFHSLPVNGIRLLIAVDGNDGVLQARQHRPDLVLLDMHLPDIDGFGVLRRLREDPRTTGLPVIALSADALPEQLQRARDAGFEAYWTKPIDFRRVRVELSRRFPAKPPAPKPADTLA